jgi:thiol-disulfide isomerase/thioredoxin
MKINFAKLNGILEAKAGRAIDRLDGLKCYSPEFQETLDAILLMLDASKELDTYDTECQDCKHQKEADKSSATPDTRLKTNDPRDLLGKIYNPLTPANRKNPYVVMFYSEHCGPCVYLKPIVEEYAIEHNIDVEFVSVDSQEGNKHAIESEIRGWPTVFVVQDDRIADIFVGADVNVSTEMTKNRLDSQIGRFFN